MVVALNHQVRVVRVDQAVVAPAPHFLAAMGHQEQQEQPTPEEVVVVVDTTRLLVLQAAQAAPALSS